MKRFTYEDPTGGGDNITVSVPEWIEMPPDTFVAYDINGERVAFDLDPTPDTDD